MHLTSAALKHRRLPILNLKHKHDMVSLEIMRASNAQISAKLPPGLVAVFVGATNGIGENTIKQFAKYTTRPRVYFIGRSLEAAKRIKAECEAVNPQGEYIFIQKDTSLIRNVDQVCNEIKSKENTINLLFMTTGTLAFGTKTSEGMHYAFALAYFARVRFIENLLPQLQRATSLRRVVSVFTAGKEGPIYTNDWEAWHVPLYAARGHGASMVTLSHEILAKQAPNVSFIHNFPGAVKGGVLRETKGVLFGVLKIVSAVLGPLSYMNPVECGDRQLFFATSARFPAGHGTEPSGVPLVKGLSAARGSDGVVGSGAYSVEVDGESASLKVERVLTELRAEGVREKMWEFTQEQFQRVIKE